MPGGKDILENRKNINTGNYLGVYPQRNSEFSNKDGLSKEQRYKERGDRMKMFGILSTAINQSVKSDKKIEIKSIEDFKTLDRRQRKIAYTTIISERNSILSQASFEEKKTIIEAISKQDLDANEKLTLSGKVLTLEEKQKRIKELLVDKNSNKDEIKNKIMGFFMVYELVDSFKPTYSREKSNVFFAKKAGVSISIDNNGKEKYSKTLENNEIIRNRILGVMLDLSAIYNAGANLLDENHSDWLKEKIINSDKKLVIADALSALSTTEQKKLNKLNKAQFQYFLEELDKLGSINANNIKNKFGVEEKAQNILGFNLEMSVIGEKLDKVKLLFETAGGNIEITEQERKIYCEKIGINYPISENKKNEFDVVLLEERIKSSNIDKEKKDKLLEEVDNIKSNIYTAYEKYGRTIELKQVRGAEYYSQVEQNYISQQQVETQKYQNTESGKEFNKVGQKLMGEKQFLQLFDQNQITSEKLKGDLSDEEYKNLLIENKQEGNPENQQKLQKQREYVLLDTTNNEIKNRFVNRITYFFSNILDVQIDEGGKENILENLKIDQNQIENNQITIQGKYQNQNLTFTYDTITGELFTGKRLHIDDHSQNVSVNNKMVRLENVSGPTFGEHIKQSNSISYSDILKKSEGNQESYAEELNKQLTIKCPLPNQSDDFKEEMSLQSLQNIVSQEVFEMMGLKDKKRTKKAISGSENQSFPLLARSIKSYNKDQLLQFRFVIKDMVAFYDQQKQISSIESKTELIEKNLAEFDKDINYEKYKPLKKIVNKLFSVRKREKIKTDYMGEQFAPFFNSFLSERLKSSDGYKIIDPQKLYSYKEDLHQIDSKSTNKTYFSDLQENMQPLFAEEGLENYFENAKA